MGFAEVAVIVLAVVALLVIPRVWKKKGGKEALKRKAGTEAKRLEKAGREGYDAARKPMKDDTDDMAAEEADAGMRAESSEPAEDGPTGEERAAGETSA